MAAAAAAAGGGRRETKPALPATEADFLAWLRTLPRECSRVIADGVSQEAQRGNIQVSSTDTMRVPGPVGSPYTVDADALATAPAKFKEATEANNPYAWYTPKTTEERILFLMRSVSDEAPQMSFQCRSPRTVFVFDADRWADETGQARDGDPPLYPEDIQRVVCYHRASRMFTVATLVHTMDGKLTVGVSAVRYNAETAPDPGVRTGIPPDDPDDPDDRVSRDAFGPGTADTAAAAKATEVFKRIVVRLLRHPRPDFSSRIQVLLGDCEDLFKLAKEEDLARADLDASRGAKAPSAKGASRSLGNLMAVQQQQDRDPMVPVLYLLSFSALFWRLPRAEDLWSLYPSPRVSNRLFNACVRLRSVSWLWWPMYRESPEGPVVKAGDKAVTLRAGFADSTGAANTSVEFIYVPAASLDVRRLVGYFSLKDRRRPEKEVRPSDRVRLPVAIPDRKRYLEPLLWPYYTVERHAPQEDVAGLLWDFFGTWGDAPAGYTGNPLTSDPSACVRKLDSLCQSRGVTSLELVVGPYVFTRANGSTAHKIGKESAPPYVADVPIGEAQRKMVETLETGFAAGVSSEKGTQSVGVLGIKRLGGDGDKKAIADYTQDLPVRTSPMYARAFRAPLSFFRRTLEPGHVSQLNNNNNTGIQAMINTEADPARVPSHAGRNEARTAVWYALRDVLPMTPEEQTDGGVLVSPYLGEKAPNGAYQDLVGWLNLLEAKSQSMSAQKRFVSFGDIKRKAAEDGAVGRDEALRMLDMRTDYSDAGVTAAEFYRRQASGGNTRQQPRGALAMKELVDRLVAWGF